MSVRVKNLIISTLSVFILSQSAVIAGESKSLVGESFSVIDLGNAVAKTMNPNPTDSPRQEPVKLLNVADEAVRLINMVQINDHAVYLKLKF